MDLALNLERPAGRYTLALSITAVCLILTFWVNHLLNFVTFQFSILAVVLSAWYSGLGPGLLSSVLLSIATIYLLEPIYTFAIDSLEDMLRLGVFVLVSVLMSILSEARRRAERALRHKTAELEAANRELEAFSYSVSHDLRSPLRVIDNHARVALEAAPSLAPVARSLQGIRGTAQQMGQLVDDLLSFSRLGRQPLHKRATDVSDLVRSVLKDLHDEQEGRTIEISISALPPCEADPAMLKVVFTNLLHNALKFTRNRERAQITVGCERRSGDETVYFVKDNGIGFDMQFTQQLFGMFQRLHREEDIEGTGVGLAIVRRIIDRHGGKIWAEAKPGEGATFYFTVQGAEAL